MNIELKDLSHNPVYAQVREQLQALEDRDLISFAELAIPS